ncbi:MAG: DUF3291 domain-containing protein [Actinomycetes bacterium]
MHVAQLNIARMVDGLSSPRLADFVTELGPVNRRAESAEGFVWRLVSSDGRPAAFEHRWDGDPLVLVNLSVWTSPRALVDFVIEDPGHASVLRRRRRWFQPAVEPMTVLWWIPDGHRPTLDEAAERLAHLRQFGPTAYAFRFRLPVPDPDPAQRSWWSSSA